MSIHAFVCVGEMYVYWYACVCVCVCVCVCGGTLFFNLFQLL